jgi:hypothetical protein
MRGGARTAGEWSYGLYIGILLVALVVVPIVVGVLEVLRGPAVLALILSPTWTSGLALGLGGLLVVAFLTGTVRGPALESPFVVATLLGSDLPRRVTLARSLRTSGLLVVGLGLAVGFLASWATASPGGQRPVEFLLFSVGVVCYGIAVLACWLVGQAARGHALWMVPAALTLAVGLSAGVPSMLWAFPWSWLADLWPTAVQQPGVIGRLVALAVLAIGSLLLSGRIMDGLGGGKLMEQAHRWEIATISAYTGDVQGAFAKFRAKPSAGRRWDVVKGESFGRAVVVSDILGLFRAPGRAFSCLLALLLGGVALAAAPSTGDGLGWVLAVGGALLTYSGLGGVTDGLRHAVAAISSSRIYGVSDSGLVAFHVVSAWLGGAVAVGAGMLFAMIGVGGDIKVAVAGVALVLSLVTVRVFDAAKGQPPSSLAVPVATPMGDLSAVSMVIWQLDAVLLASVFGILAFGSLTVFQPVPSMAVALLLCGCVFVLWRRRIRALGAL